MKKLLFTLYTFLTVNVLMAQVPNLLNYQAVARNSTGQPMAGKTIQVRFTITQNAIVQYSETRQAVTNAQGLFDVQIGTPGASAVMGSLNNINWLNNNPGYFLKVELDVHGAGQFTDMGMQKLATVPYSLASGQSARSVNSIHALNSDTASVVLHADTVTMANALLNIMGKPIDQQNEPAPNKEWQFDGSKWIMVGDTTIGYKGAAVVQNLVLNAWNMVGYTTITVKGNETVIARFNAEIAMITAPAMFDLRVCYQDITPGSSVTSFYGTNPGPRYIFRDPSVRSQVYAVGAIKLPPGTYRVGLGLKPVTAISIRPSLVSGEINIKH